MEHVAKEDLATAAPDLHFSLTLEERIKGYSGPPAWSVRLRRIEDEHAGLVARLLEAWPAVEAEHAGDRWAAVDALVAQAAAAPELPRLNGLIDTHNRYYPCEGNLAMDPRTGAYLERGRPWTPLPRVTAESLVEEAIRTRRR
jgi:hypothetical protein